MGIDLNTIEEEEEENESSPELPPAGTGDEGSVCLELWHACAGPRISLPKKGSLVVYLPQGHLEHLAGDRRGGGGVMLRYDVPPHVVCRVVEVQLRVRGFLSLLLASLLLSLGLSGLKIGFCRRRRRRMRFTPSFLWLLRVRLVCLRFLWFSFAEIESFRSFVCFAGV